MQKILLVDDMRNFLDLEKSFLKRAECRIYTATTGLEAIKVAKTEIPDIIMLDVEMPEMNGIEATRILKNDPQTKGIPIVIVTSLDNMEEKAKVAGCDAFYRKPIDEDTFLQVIQSFIELKIRKFPRVALNVPVKIKENSSLFEGEILNISLNGVYLKSDYRPFLGSLVELFFSIPIDGEEKQIQTLAYVVRQDKEGFGCAFFDLSTGAEIYIKEYIKKNKDKAEQY